MLGAPQHAFGLSLSSEFELPGLRPSGPAGSPVSIRMAAPGEVVHRAGSGTDQVLWTTVTDDGQEVRLERSPTGHHRLEYGRRALFLLSPDGETLLCEPAEPADPSWKRFLLDTVLVTTSLLHGFEALHASAVEVEGKVLAFAGTTGAGKTSVVWELMRRGATLFCDDVLALEAGPANVIAHPGPALMNVPLSAFNGSRPQPEPRSLAVLGDEAWVEVGGPPMSPAGPAAIFLLHRRPDCDGAAVHPEQSSLALLAHALGVEGTGARLRRRFEMLGDLAAEVPVYRLEAHPAASPDLIADVVEERLVPITAADRVGA